MADNKIEKVETIEEAKETTQPVVTPAMPQTKSQKHKKDKKNTKKKEKKDNLFKKTGKRLKETNSELKKVTWPKFGKVVKQTGVVISIVLIFAVVLLGIDKLLEFLFGLLIK